MGLLNLYAKKNTHKPQEDRVPAGDRAVPRTTVQGSSKKTAANKIDLKQGKRK